MKLTALLYVYREWAELWARRDGWYIGAEGLVRCGFAALPGRQGYCGQHGPKKKRKGKAQR